MNRRITFSARNISLLLPISLLAVTLGACYETSYDKAIAGLNAGNPPPTTSPPTTGFGPNFSEIQTNVFTELVGEFSNQNGQSAVMLVAPADPDASYLIRKLENAAGITGSRMPLGSGPLRQSDIDEIRQWIADGAAR